MSPRIRSHDLSIDEAVEISKEKQGNVDNQAPVAPTITEPLKAPLFKLAVQAKLEEAKKTGAPTAALETLAKKPGLKDRVFGLFKKN